MAKKGKHFRALDEARAAGYVVETEHVREESVFLGYYSCLPIRGYTRVRLHRLVSGDIDTLDMVRVATGVAFCSAKDNFNRRLGVQIACGRALKQAQGR